MSSSVFKEYPSSHTDGDNSKADSNLIVFINKNGDVSVDQSALQDLLVNDATDTNTSVSVIRVESPTPSLQLELDEEAEQSKHLTENELSDGLDTNENREDVAHVSVTVESFYNPVEAKQLASDILSIAGITNPLQIAIDYEFQRYVIANDHCYTPLTSPSQRKTANVSTPALGPLRKDVKSKPKLQSTHLRERLQSTKSIIEISDEEEKESDDENNDSGSDLSYLSPSDSDNDRDSDLDFNVNERSSRVKKFNRSKRIKQIKTAPKVVRKRRGSEVNNFSESNNDESNTSLNKRKTVKTPKKNTSIRPITTTTPTPISIRPAITSTPIAALNKSKVIPITKINVTKIAPKPKADVPDNKEQTPVNTTETTKIPSAIVTIPGPPVPALAPITETPKPQPIVPKKDRKPPAHVEALFSDMSSLFSTPDIIKKVGGIESRATLINPNTPPVATTSAQNKCYFMALTPNNKIRQQLPAQISVRVHNSSSSTLASEQLDLIDSIVQQELKQNAPPTTATMSEDIPNIVKMLEIPEGILGNVINLNNNPTTTANTLSFPTTITHETPLLDDSDLLDGLTNPDDGLTEDLLQHVAKLVEDKNLQEVIDKQVLGVSTTTKPSATVSTFTTTTPKPAVIVQEKITQMVKVVQPQQKVVEPTIVSRGKEPIKIMRSDGRIITLPPIEAPTTRGAKRRAQNQPTVEPQKRKEEPVTPQPRNIQHLPKENAGGILKEKETKERRSSVSQKKHGEQQPAAAAKKQTDPYDDEYDDEDSDGSYNSEDDPFRLWCICRQPHNNRFMICCDKCEDWFHGKCVNVTKAMGIEMEDRGVEWVCPNCLKKQQPVKKALDIKPTTPVSLPTTSMNLDNSLLSCIVCKKSARQSSIYCSDDCIRQHAQATTTSIATQMEQAEAEKARKLAAEQTKPVPKLVELVKNNNRVVVYERQTGRCLTGNSAPPVENLKQWLHEHPTFEIVQPGSAQALAIKAKQMQLKQQAKELEAEKQNQLFAVIGQQQKIQTSLKIGPQKKVIVFNSQKQLGQSQIQQNHQQQPQQRQQQQIQHVKTVPKISKIPQQVTLKPGSPIKVTAPISKVQPSTSKTTSLPRPVQLQQQNKKKLSEKTTEEKSPTSTKIHPEPIRINVQRTLMEQLSLRSSEMTDIKFPKLSDEEISKFVLETEEEIFNLFNKDTGAKYRAKYRSLMFNIKDRKNQTLFHKICNKAIEPKQLVRMSAEELASQQLAQWRENENKHQLEMIKKSELDLLACAKSYVMKTHKGEEVIESKVSDRVTLDPSISVEDVVSVLNNSTVSSTSENLEQVSPIVKDTRIDSRFEKYLSVDSSSSNSSKTHLGISSASKKKESRRSRSRSRSRDRHDSKKSSSKYKRKRSKERRSKSRDRNREKERDRDSKKKDDKRDKEKIKDVMVSKDVTSKKVNIIKPKDTPKPSKKEENFNLIDKILEAQTTIDRVLRPEESKKDEEIKAINKPTPPLAEAVKKTISTESDQEPSSTVTIPTPPESLYEKDTKVDDAVLWNGSIIMVDVATFQISARSFSGDCMGIKKELPIELDVVGRISPETVWDYIAKIKKSINKEILILRFAGSTDEEHDAYYTLYKYLHTRKRLGVVKTTSASIKDFYIFPLAAHKSLPSVLMPIQGAGFESGRPDLLLGIIVKITSPPNKRPAASTSGPVKIARLAVPQIKPKHKVPISIEERYTPPSSPKLLSKSKLKLLPPAILPPTDYKKAKVIEDGDEPYSPGGSDNEDSAFIPPMPLPAPPLPPQIPISPAQLESDEIQRKMEELNRQIEAQKMEIAGMLQPDNVIDEPYSPTSSLSIPTTKRPIPALANISIPSNLQEILNSIKNVSSESSTMMPHHPPANNLESDDEYTPIPVAPLAYKHSADYIPSKTLSLNVSNLIPLPQLDAQQIISKQPSKLAQLTDEELLSMVPDDAKVDIQPPPMKKSRYDAVEPPPPGLEDEYVP